MQEPAPEQQLVDVHAHFVTDHYAELAKAAGHERPDGMPGWPSWDVDSHLALMDEGGIRTSVLSISSPGVHFGDDRAARSLAREVNEYGAGLKRDHPGRFGHFASLPLPDVTGALDELAHALDTLGSDGVTLESNAGGRYLGHPDFEPLWAELDSRRAVVFVHPTSPSCAEAVSLGRPRPMLEFIFDSTRTVSDLVFNGVLTRYPGIQWLFTHGAGTLPLLADRMELFRSGFMGGSADVPRVQEQVGRLWFDIAGTPFPNQVPALVSAFGSAQVLYGSDYCWTPAAGALAQVRSVDAAVQPDGDTWRALTTRNATRLLPGLLDGPR
ncbi:amidohydrolase family protein [Streptomyces sp. NPDC049954]|uniref:amidohydrolase family protein n=1 Tax=Streptomyces sp. NPDC049954 TaxID=3155779 RepID=UPI00341503A4